MNNDWTHEERDLLVTLWTDGYSTKQIAEELDKTFGSVKMYLQRHRKELGLKPRTGSQERKTSFRPEFDKAWHGVIPLGHWLITKPWGKSCAVKPATKS